MSELQRLKSLLPPENESWVFVEAAAAIDPPLITLEEIGRDEVEIQICLLYTSPSPRDPKISRMPSSA